MTCFSECPSVFIHYSKDYVDEKVITQHHHSLTIYATILPLYCKLLDKFDIRSFCKGDLDLHEQCSDEIRAAAAVVLPLFSVCMWCNSQCGAHEVRNSV